MYMKAIVKSKTIYKIIYSTQPDYGRMFGEKDEL